MNQTEYETLLQEIRETRTEVRKIKEEVCTEKGKLSTLDKIYFGVFFTMLASLYTCGKIFDGKLHAEELHPGGLEYKIESVSNQ